MLTMTAQGKITSQPATLRERLAQISPEFAIQEQQRKSMIAMQETAARTMLQKLAAQERKEVLGKARAALGKANKVARQNGKLGNAIKSAAVRDLNCLRSKCECVEKLAKACNVVELYSNAGRIWNV